MEKNFWFITLCTFLIIASFIGLIIPLRIAIAGNAILIFIDIGRQFVEVLHGREKAN